MVDRGRRRRLSRRPDDQRAGDVACRDPGLRARDSPWAVTPGRTGPGGAGGARPRLHVRLVRHLRAVRLPARSGNGGSGELRTRPADATGASRVHRLRGARGPHPGPARRPTRRLLHRRARHGPAGAPRSVGATRTTPPAGRVPPSGSGADARGADARARLLPVRAPSPASPDRLPALDRLGCDGACLRVGMDHRAGRDPRPLAHAPAPGDAARAVVRGRDRPPGPRAARRSRPASGQRGRPGSRVRGERDQGALRLLHRPARGNLLRPLRASRLADARHAPGTRGRAVDPVGASPAERVRDRPHARRVSGPVRGLLADREARRSGQRRQRGCRRGRPAVRGRGARLETAAARDSARPRPRAARDRRSVCRRSRPRRPEHRDAEEVESACRPVLGRPLPPREGDARGGIQRLSRHLAAGAVLEPVGQARRALAGRDGIRQLPHRSR